MKTFDVTFDLARTTAAFRAAYHEVARKGTTAEKIDGWCAALAQVMISCPAHWGLPNDPDTYLNLSWDDELIPLIEQVFVEGKGQTPENSPAARLFARRSRPNKSR